MDWVGPLRSLVPMRKLLLPALLLIPCFLPAAKDYFPPPDTKGGWREAKDPAAARKLLADAGFPNGFALTLHGPNDRYPNDARLAQAVGQMWTRIGVRTQVEVSPYASFVTRASKQEFAAFVVKEL